MKRELSVFLITKQEGANLRTCLESVKGLADEIIILDSGSTDDTLKIAAEFNAKTGFKEFESFTEQKKRRFENVLKTVGLKFGRGRAAHPGPAQRNRRFAFFKKYGRLRRILP